MMHKLAILSDLAEQYRAVIEKENLPDLTIKSTPGSVYGHPAWQSTLDEENTRLSPRPELGAVHFGRIELLMDSLSAP